MQCLRVNIFRVVDIGKFLYVKMQQIAREKFLTLFPYSRWKMNRNSQLGLSHHSRSISGYIQCCCHHSFHIFSVECFSVLTRWVTKRSLFYTMSKSKYLKDICHWQIFVRENATNSRRGCSYRFLIADGK
jgi:hypothetical protein